MEDISEAFLALDTAARFTYVNRQAEELFGRRREELLGRGIWDCFPDLRGSRMQHEYDAAAGSRQPVEFEEFHAERQAWLEVRAYPSAEGMALYYRDVTKRHDAEEAQRALMAMVSHDLRNPLFLIKGTVEVVREQLRRAGFQGVDADLRRIDRAAGHMNRVIDDLMDLAQLQSGHAIALDRAPIDLAELVTRVVEAHRYTTDVHDLVLAGAVSRLVGEWDERRLERVLANLLSNAIKYSPAESEIVVSVARGRRGGAPCAILTVADQGIGIADADLPHIFERFYRAEAVAGVIPGAGVGLAGVRHIVHEHGGEVEVASCLGQGTTVTVHLPLAPSSEHPL